MKSAYARTSLLINGLLQKLTRGGCHGKKTEGR
jgi:hypothetical protein